MTDSLDEPPQSDELGDDTQELEPEPSDESALENDVEEPSEKEEALGQLLGEEIDPEDDDDSGIGDPDELAPEEKVSPYADGEVVQDADVGE